MVIIDAMNSLRILLTGLILNLIFIGTSLSAPDTDNEDAWKGLTEAQINKVKSGEVVILDKDQSKGEESGRFIQAAVIFNQPIEVVWKLFRQTEKQEQYLPDLVESQLVEDNGNWDRVDFFVKILFIDIRYRVKHNFEPENYYFYWGLDHDYKNDLKHLEGYWRLYKLDDNHTLGRYGTIVILSSVIPKSIMEIMTRQNLPTNMSAVKKYIDSGGSYAKPNYKK